MTLRVTARKSNSPSWRRHARARKATGQRLTLEEVALYTVKNDKITREQFFYEGEH